MPDFAAVRGSFEMEKAEKTRTRERRGRSSVKSIENENCFSEKSFSQEGTVAGG